MRRECQVWTVRNSLSEHLNLDLIFVGVVEESSDPAIDPLPDWNLGWVLYGAAIEMERRGFNKAGGVKLGDEEVRLLARLHSCSEPHECVLIATTNDRLCLQLTAFRVGAAGSSKRRRT